MKIEVKRFEFLDTSTIGRLFIDGEDTGLFTLEDKVREIPSEPVSSWKIPGQTAIPRGIYSVVVDYSDHMKRILPRLLNVPGFEGVRIHPGNTDADTEGCILVGRTWSGTGFIGSSRAAFGDVFTRIKAAKDVQIEVR